MNIFKKEKFQLIAKKSSAEVVGICRQDQPIFDDNYRLKPVYRASRDFSFSGRESVSLSVKDGSAIVRISEQPVSYPLYGLRNHLPIKGLCSEKDAKHFLKF